MVKKIIKKVYVCQRNLLYFVCSYRDTLLVSAVSDSIDPELIEIGTVDRMEKSFEALRGNLNTVRTGRANTKMLDRIEVEYYGTLTPLRSLANTSTPDAQTIVIQPFDKNVISDIERAIMSSDLGLTPGNDGDSVRLNIPSLTAERRKDLVKLVSKLGEDTKVALRNIRRDSLRSFRKLDGYSEDDMKLSEARIDKLTSDYALQVDKLIKMKEVDLSSV